MKSNNFLSTKNKLLKDFSVNVMKTEVSACGWFLYQPKVPQKVIERFKK